MNGAAKYLWTALAVAVVAHIAYIHFLPRLTMAAAMSRIAGGAYNAWRVSDRVTPASRTIVRPSPDFAYSACAYDLSRGPVTINVAPWEDYWSLSLYAANSDNFFVIDDREVDGAAAITLTRRAPGNVDTEEADIIVVESPSSRGIALIRRLAPTLDAYNAAVRVAAGDLCASQAD